MFLNQFPLSSSAQQTYAERLGWQKDERVIIFHIDDVGMSYESNEGAKQALDYGVATSFSIMMPCPWVPDIAGFVRKNPQVDAGLHLTFTSEWKKYRWTPLAGINATPGLTDHEGAFWDNVADVLAHASADEIDLEMSAQLSRARRMGIAPTHLDTHMGTLWSSPEFLDRYIAFGIREHLPVLLTAGHNTLLSTQVESGPLAGLKKLNPARTSGSDHKSLTQSLRAVGEKLWNAGLPVADDLYISSYDWEFPANQPATDENLQKFKVARYKELLHATRPGITVILVHCTEATSCFSAISDSGATRRADLLAMLDHDLKDFIQREGFVLTTWREMQDRRLRVK